MIEAFPLHWPDGWKRTAHPERSRFQTGFNAARIFLTNEISRMGGTNVIISTNVPLRNDGMPRASAPEPKDAGVAVYFRHKGRSMVFACDKYYYTRDNIYAIGKTIEALRGIERWGASDMMERAFTGFKALTDTAGAGEDCWMVLGIPPMSSAAEISSAHRKLAMEAHPDRGGSHEQMSRVNAARDAAMQAVSA